MTHALVRLKVADYEKWRAVFEEASALRQAYSSQGVTVFRSVDQPDEVVILGVYGDLERARQLFHAPEFRQATQRAGVIGQPEVAFLDEMGRLPA